MTTNVQEAIDCIAKKLMEMADGAEAPPRIELNVQWIDASTIERRAWYPTVSLTASSEKVVNLADI